jgi:predicted O-methyltransferase YrrM
MKFNAVQALVGHVPFISPANAEYLYKLILREKLDRILELGIAHGTATCYMAAALQELGRGKITCVDLLEAAHWYRPSPEEQLSLTGLGEFAEIFRMKTGYTWFLHDKIRESTTDDICREEYDLCVIDGPKNWTIDGGAFFFVDKLLKPGGWLVFDDYLWTYEEANSRRDATDGITHRTLSDDERKVPHIRDVFELLVVQHPNYANFIRLRSWAIAQKIPGAAKTYTVKYEFTYKDFVVRALHKVGRRLHLIKS